MKNKGIIRMTLATALLLLVPLIAMQFTDQVNWTPGDFIVAGALLLSTGLAYEFVSGKRGAMVYKAAVGLAIGTALILTWVNLAVGIIGSGMNAGNLMYGGVIVIGVTGALIARLEPRGMAIALFATALAQALVPVIALMIMNPGSWEAPGVSGIFLLNTFFVLLFAGSALLFLRAGKNPQTTA